VGVEEVSWDKGGTLRAGDYNFFMAHRLVSAVKGV
jgi:hypothetical protein